MEKAISEKPSEHPSAAHLGSELNQLVAELTKHQESTLALLDEKMRLLLHLDGQALKALEPKQRAASVQFERYMHRRRDLLTRAAESGIHVTSLQDLARHLPTSEHRRATSLLNQTATLAKRMHHRCLTNWVLAQRALVHTNQLLGILAGGESDATYGQSRSGARGGTLIDQAV